MKRRTINRKDVIRQLKMLVRDRGVTWPGGYPVHAVMCDGEAICWKCARENFRQIVRDTEWNDRMSGWCCAGVEINYEDDDLMCAHCNDKIESAYGEE